MAHTPRSRRSITLDTLAEPHWSDSERAYAATVVSFLQGLMNDHDFEGVLRAHADGAYLQHNRAIPDGVPGVVGYLRALTRRFPEYGYDVKRIVASGDIVVTHSHVTLRHRDIGNEKKGFIITDTFRLEDGRLAEHWDAIQPIDLTMRLVVLLTGGRIANANATF
ncbi:MAG: nuclear transport factor 2 family protein [Pseudomonadota bacterium]